MGRRTLLLIASILVAAVGTALIGLYVRGADTRARGNATLVPVLVATQQIDAGTTPDTDTYEVSPRRAGDLPKGYLTDKGQIKGRAVSRILPGQTLQLDMFSTTGVRTSRVLADGHQAVSITVGDPQRVASLLTPDSQVVIYMTPKSDKSGGQAVAVFGQNPVTVIGVGDDTGTLDSTGSTSGSSGSSNGSAASQNQNLPRTNITLDLESGQVTKLLDNQAAGELSFGYVGPAPTPTPGG